MEYLDVVIVGGGVSGLACARSLWGMGCQNFVLVTRDIGGRVCTSADGKVNYGAYYVRHDYRHILRHVELKRRLRPRSVYWFANGEIHPLGQSITQHPLATTQLLWHVNRFDRRYQRFKKHCETQPQRVAIRSDWLLNKLFDQDAVEFLHQHRLDCLVDCLINPIAWATALLDVRDMSASTLLFLLLILVHPTYEFEFAAQGLVQPFAEKIKLDEVVAVQSIGRHWQLTTRQGNTYQARNVVSAIPIQAATELLDLDLAINAPVNAHMVHVQGQPRSPFDRARYVVLAPQTREIVIAKQADGTQILYSRSPDIDLAKYFSQWNVLAKKSWCPAFHIGKHLIECHIGHNLYLIGDHNAVSLEDSYITGIYAANQIRRQLNG